MGRSAILREPLFQFAVGGALLFAADAWLRPSAPRLVVPVVAGADGAVDDAARRDAIDRALLVAEARARGLDRDDVIVRRRLEQKMRFVLEGAEPAGLDDAALAHQLAAAPERYRGPDRYDFRHVFVDRGRHRDAAAQAEAWREAALAGSAPAGDPFLHGRRQRAADPATIATRFGDAFAEAIAKAPVGTWTTIESSFGWHVVVVDARRPGALPSVDEARDRLRADLRATSRADNLRRGLDALRSRYDVEIVAVAAADEGRR